MASISGRVEHRHARPDQRLGDSRIVGEAASAGIFASAEQCEAEQGGRDHPRQRSHKPDLDRVTDQEHPGEDQRSTAQPDQEPPGDQPLEQPAEALGPGRLLLQYAVGLPVEADRRRLRRLLHRFDERRVGRRRRERLAGIEAALEPQHPGREIELRDRKPDRRQNQEKDQEFHRRRQISGSGTSARSPAHTARARARLRSAEAASPSARSA